ncbi:MAG: ankyrin repeat domain-containing protein, partial [Gammaproteobacteria bacterium]
GLLFSLETIISPEGLSLFDVLSSYEPSNYKASNLINELFLNELFLLEPISSKIMFWILLNDSSFFKNNFDQISRQSNFSSLINNDGDNILMFLLKKRPTLSSDIINLILDSKLIDPNSKDSNGKDLLSIAIEYSTYDFSKIFNSLLEQGAQPSIQHIVDLIKKQPYQWIDIFKGLIKKITCPNKISDNQTLIEFLFEINPKLDLIESLEAIIENMHLDLKSGIVPEQFWLPVCANASKKQNRLSGYFLFEIVKKYPIDLSIKIKDRTLFELLKISSLESDIQNSNKIFKELLENKAWGINQLPAELKNIFEDLLPASIVREGLIRDYIKKNSLPEINSKPWFKLIQMLFESDDCFKHKNKDQKDSIVFSHKFSLNGLIELSEKNSIDLEGSDNKFFIIVLLESFSLFIKNNPNEDSLKELHEINQILMRSALFSNNDRLKLNSEEKMGLTQNAFPSVSFFPAGWKGHGTSIVIDKRNGLFYRCNKGSGLIEKDIIEIYTINKPRNLTHDLIEKLNKSTKENQKFIQEEIITLLDLKFLEAISGKPQTVGNCAWAGLKCGLRALLMCYFSKDIARQIYKDWSSFDKNNAFEFYRLKYQNSSFFTEIAIRFLEIHHGSNKHKLRCLSLAEHLMSEKPKELISYFSSTDKISMSLALSKFKNPENKDYVEETHRNWAGFGLIEKERRTKPSPEIEIYTALISKEPEAVEKAIENLLLLEKTESGFQLYYGWTPLHFIASLNDIDLLRKIPQEIIIKWVNQENQDKKTPVFYTGSTEVAKYLVSCGAVLETGEDFDSLLNQCISDLKYQMVDYLLSKGIHPNSETGYVLGWVGDIRLLTLFLEYNSGVFIKNIMGQTYFGATIFHSAAKGHHFEFIKFLFSRNLCIEEQDPNGFLPEHWLLSSSGKDESKKEARLKTLEALFSYPKKNLIFTFRAQIHRTRTNLSDLDSSTLQSVLPDFQEEKEKKIPNATESDLQHFNSTFTPKSIYQCLTTFGSKLHAAISHKDIPSIRACIAQDLKLNWNAVMPPFSTAPLHAAIGTKNLEIYLLIANLPFIDFNLQANTLEYPLHMAIAYGAHAILKDLLTRPKIDLNTKSLGDYTPLMEAVDRDDLISVKMLMQDPRVRLDLKNKQGKTALDLAENKPKIFEFFRTSNRLFEFSCMPDTKPQTQLK